MLVFKLNFSAWVVLVVFRVIAAAHYTTVIVKNYGSQLNKCNTLKCNHCTELYFRTWHRLAMSLPPLTSPKFVRIKALNQN